jgi:hypothetical protein
MYFSSSELSFSETAIRKGIDNTPPPEVIDNLHALSVNVLNPLYERFRSLLHVNSCYRSPKLNKAIGGSNKSQHTLGQAVDITVNGVSNKDLFEWVQKNLVYDQVIEEFNSWVHISFSEENRGQKLIATKENGKTIYTTIS